MQNDLNLKRFTHKRQMEKLTLDRIGIHAFSRTREHYDRVEMKSKDLLLN